MNFIRDLIAPPLIPLKGNVKYDSVRSNLELGNNEYAIYSNNRAYPYYLITIKL